MSNTFLGGKERKDGREFVVQTHLVWIRSGGGDLKRSKVFLPLSEFESGATPSPSPSLPLPAHNASHHFIDCYC